MSYFPARFERYFEPFLGSGAVLATLAPARAVASDVYAPLIEIWNALCARPETLLAWYADRYRLIESLGKRGAYESVRDAFNRSPNGADFVFLTRSCYGGVIRFRKEDGHMSTPCGAHDPITPAAFEKRILEWAPRVASADFLCCGFDEAMDQAQAGDLVYCDPPYPFSQSIVYGAQTFRIESLLDQIRRCKERGVYVALSLGSHDHKFPKGLFERDLPISVGLSMLRRFQIEGETPESERVTDRLLLTY